MRIALVAVIAIASSSALAQKLAVDPSGLDPAQRAAFDKLLAEEVCPCDCPKSLGQCLQEGTKCKPAVLLGEWAIKSLEEGVPADSVAEALAREVKHFPLSFHAMAKKAAVAAEAAGRQNKFWPMHDALFATQDILSDELILGHAKALGLDVARFQKDLADPALAKRVEDSRNEGVGFGIDATPAFFVDGRPYFLHRSVDGFELRLRMDEARASSSCQ
jgi:hypothetical protein